MDEGAVNVAKAIRQVESGGDFNAKGKSGESGAYQWTPDTWKAHAKEALGDENAQMTKENQNAVAYTIIKKWKDSGLNVAQIAAKWNSGSESGWEKKVGTNKYGVHYDVPKYVKSVTDGYQTLKTGGQVGADPNNPSSTAAPQPQEGIGSQILHGIGDLAKNITSPLATLLARPYQLAATTLGGQSDEQASNVPLLSSIYGKMPVPRTGGDLVKDVGRAAETISLGLPVSSVGKAALTGFIGSAGHGLETTGTLKGAAEEGLTGGLLGGAGGIFTKALKFLPKSLLGSAFKGLGPEEVEKALQTKSIGTSASLFRQSQKALGEYEAQIGTLLKQNATKGLGNNAVKETLTQFPEYAKAPQKLLTKIKSLISSENTIVGQERSSIVSYIDKIARGNATLAEKNAVRKAIDRSTKGGFAKLAKAMNPSAGHDIGMTFADALREEIKKLVPAARPVFEEYSKEVAFKNAVQKVGKTAPKGIVRWSDVAPILVGFFTGGPGGAVGAVLTERAAENPAIQFAGAKVANRVGKIVSPAISRAGLLPTLLSSQQTSR